MTQNWFLATDGEPLGPFTLAQVKALAVSGRLRPEDRVRLEGQTYWVKASAVKALFPAPTGSSWSVVGTANQPAVVVPAASPAASVASGKPPVVESPKAKGAVAALLSWRQTLAAAGAVLAAALLVGGLVKARHGGPEPARDHGAFEGGRLERRPTSQGEGPAETPALSSVSDAQTPTGTTTDDGPEPVRTGSDLDDMARLLGQEAVVGPNAIRRPADPQLIEEIRARAGSSVPEVREASRAAEEAIKYRGGALKVRADANARTNARLNEAASNLPDALAHLDDVSDSELDDAVFKRQITKNQADDIRKSRRAGPRGAAGRAVTSTFLAILDHKNAAGPIRWNRKRAEVLEAEVFAKQLVPALRARAGARVVAPPVDLKVGLKPDHVFNEMIGLITGSSTSDRPLTRVALLVTVEVPIGKRYVAAYFPKLAPSEVFRLTPFGADYHELRVPQGTEREPLRGVRYSIWCDQFSAEDVEVPVGDNQGGVVAYTAQFAAPGSSYLADPNKNMGARYKADKAKAELHRAINKREADKAAKTGKPLHPLYSGDVEMPDPTLAHYLRFGLTFTEMKPQGPGYFIRAKFDRYDAEDPSKLRSSETYEGTLRPSTVEEESQGKPVTKAKAKATPKPADADKRRSTRPVEPERPLLKDDLICELNGGAEALRFRVRVEQDGRFTWTPESGMLLGREFEQAEVLKGREARQAETHEKNDVLADARRLAKEGQKEEAIRIIKEFLATSPGEKWEAKAQKALKDIDPRAGKPAPRGTIRKGTGTP